MQEYARLSYASPHVSWKGKHKYLGKQSSPYVAGRL